MNNIQLSKMQAGKQKAKGERMENQSEAINVFKAMMDKITHEEDLDESQVNSNYVETFLNKTVGESSTHEIIEKVFFDAGRDTFIIEIRKTCDGNPQEAMLEQLFEDVSFSLYHNDKVLYSDKQYYKNDSKI